MWFAVVSAVLDFDISPSNQETPQACWPNGKALDYESRDCRFDPCAKKGTRYE
ncbi:hypothetical protein M7I_8255 [Glarea lozoyensis 74030]|uniref:Uncharacterized protein n=1 Tax=Glarea lozoyensis (strain ATCC 74030 / MF5533) TaxID=1104152 RepID=H0EZI6_GLAL7|nr:hypothetical protein M7I_8255 [Glarea lozoyensis 74030]